MPLFAVSRVLDHSMIAADREAQMSRTIVTLGLFPGVDWLRSFVIDEPGRWESICLYEGPTAEDVAYRTTYCRVPFREVRPVIEVLPEGYGLVDQPRPGPDAKLYLVRRQMPEGMSASELEALTFRAANCLSEIFPGVRWERSFWDEERRQSACIYFAPSAELLWRHANVVRINCESVEAVTEALPWEWEGVYDAYGVPKYWKDRSEIV